MRSSPCVAGRYYLHCVICARSLQLKNSLLLKEDDECRGHTSVNVNLSRKSHARRFIAGEKKWDVNPVTAAYTPYLPQDYDYQ